MIYYLLLFLVVVGVSAQSILQKQYNAKFSEVKNSNYLYNFCMTFVACLWFLVVFLITPTVNADSVIYSVLFAVTFCMSIVFQFLAIKTGPLALTALIISFSLLIPIVYGLIFLDETLSLYGIIGIVFLVVSLVLINDFKKGQAKISKKYLLYLILAFTGNGLCTTFQKMQQIVFDGQFGGFFMFVAMSFVALFNFVMLLKNKPPKELNIYKTGTLLAGITGVCNGFCNFIIVVLATKLPSVIVYPTLCTGNMFIVFMFALLIFKEKFKPYQYVGYVLGVLATVLLNI